MGGEELDLEVKDMSRKQSTIICSLKRQHHLLWLLLGLGFSLWLCAQLAPQGATSIVLFVGLLVTYYCAGQWAARLIARSILRWGPARLSWALMSSSLKIGVLFSLLSILFHAVLLGTLASDGGSLELLPRAQVSILLRAAIFPFLACLGAACTASSAAWSESTGMVEYPKSTSFSATTD
jgi:hypothetical protein